MSSAVNDDFKKAIKKAELYATEAVVVTIGLNDVTIEEATGWKGTEFDVKVMEYKAEELCQEFLDYLSDNSIPHAVVSNKGKSLTIALPKEDSGGEFKLEKTREIVHSFFYEGGRQVAIAMESYYQKHDKGLARLKNKFALVCTKTGREVRKNLKKINSPHGM